RQGDMFVKKAPAATIGCVAQALLELFGARNEIRVIGARHGEKLCETLVNREDMAKAEDLGDYFRVPADNRDLNYDLYFSKGTYSTSEIDEYHSHNAPRLDVEAMKTLLLTLPLIQEEVAGA